MTKKIKLTGMILSIILFTGCSAVDDLINDITGGDGQGTALGFDSPDGGYNVYGGNTFGSGGITELQDLTFIGDSRETDVFEGSYDYYVIGNDGDGPAIKIDSIEGSNGEYYSIRSASNIEEGDVERLAGAPDNEYVIIHEQGYILIDASGDNLVSITVYTDS